jgi:hypothetical protein
VSDTITAIGEELNDRAQTLDEVETTETAGSTGYARNGRLFAIADAGGFDFLLGDVIAGAARRTPDVSDSSRGAGWVRFSPSALDEPALDRALAWFEAAWRRASSPIG